MEKSNSRIGVILLSFIATVGIAVAVDTVADWSTGVSGTLGTAKITTDGTNETFTVDKISAGVTNIVQSTGMTVSGVLTVSGAQTNTSTFRVTGATTLSNLTVNSSAIKITGLPTTTNGLATGFLWSSNNVLSVIP